MWHFLLGKCFKGIHSLLIFIWRFWRHGWPGKDNDQGLQVWCKYCSVIHVLGCFLAPLLKQVDTDTADRPQQCFIRKQCSISKKNLLKKTQKRLCCVRFPKIRNWNVFQLISSNFDFFTPTHHTNRGHPYLVVWLWIWIILISPNNILWGTHVVSQRKVDRNGHRVSKNIITE